MGDAGLHELCKVFVNSNCYSLTLLNLMSLAGVRVSLSDNHITQSGIREFKNLIDYDVFHITDFGLASFSPSLV